MWRTRTLRLVDEGERVGEGAFDEGRTRDGSLMTATQ
jgi:hypothetical protein